MLFPTRQNTTEKSSVKQTLRATRYAVGTIIKIATGWTIILILSIIAETTLPILSAGYIRDIIDQIISIGPLPETDLAITISENITTIIPLLVYFFATTILSQLTSTLSNLSMDRIKDKFSQYTIDTIHNHIAKIPTEYFCKAEFQDKLDRLSRSIANTINFLIVLRKSIVNPFKVAINAVILFQFSPAITVATITTLLISTYFQTEFTKQSSSIYFASSPFSRIQHSYSEMFTPNHIEELKFHRLRKFTLKMLTQINKQFITDNLRQSQKMHITDILTSISQNLLNIANIMTITVRFFSGDITAGDITFYRTIFNRVSSDGTLLSYRVGRLSLYVLEVNDLVDLLQLPTEQPKKELPKISVKETVQKIEINNLSFTYPETKTGALKDVSLNINAGEKIALVGKNGSGKTTLVRLLIGLFKTSGNHIIISTDQQKHTLNELNKESWFKTINYVPQEYNTYPLTVRENVGFGSIEDIEDDNKIIEAMQKADILATLEQKIGTKDRSKILDSYLGRRFKESYALSGGEWQKITIARGLVNTDAEILILDEPSAHLDAEAEEKLFEHLLTTYRNKTILFISHRFTTVKDADRIIVMDKGKIVEDGTHDSLMKKEGMYKKLYEIQAHKLRIV